MEQRAYVTRTTFGLIKRKVVLAISTSPTSPVQAALLAQQLLRTLTLLQKETVKEAVIALELIYGQLLKVQAHVFPATPLLMLLCSRMEHALLVAPMQQPTPQRKYRMRTTKHVPAVSMYSLGIQLDTAIAELAQ
jgi:hypothetical protein